MKQIYVLIFIPLFFSGQLALANETPSPSSSWGSGMMYELMGNIEYYNIATGTMTINGRQYQLAPDVKIYGDVSKANLKSGMSVGYELSSSSTILKIWTPSQPRGVLNNKH